MYVTMVPPFKWRGAKFVYQHAIILPGESCAFEAWGLAATCKDGHSGMLFFNALYILFPRYNLGLGFSETW